MKGVSSEVPRKLNVYSREGKKANVDCLGVLASHVLRAALAMMGWRCSSVTELAYRLLGPGFHLCAQAHAQTQTHTHPLSTIGSAG